MADAARRADSKCALSCVRVGDFPFEAAGRILHAVSAPSMKRLLLAFCLAAISVFAIDPSAPIVLWPGGAPGSEGKSGPEKVVTSGSGERTVSSVHAPSITPFLPAKEQANGAAVLVIP